MFTIENAVGSIFSSHTGPSQNSVRLWSMDKKRFYADTLFQE